MHKSSHGLCEQMEKVEPVSKLANLKNGLRLHYFE